ncbi:MAG: CcdB family protein [Burkholderiales bacterium]|nr:CcdB family protein [Burkholderiales bacterium]
MARFDIYENPGANKAIAPFLVDVQNDFVQSLATRIVIPLVAIKAIGKKPPDDVFPLIRVKGKKYYLFTPELAAAPATRLKTLVGSAEVEDRAKIQNALDRIFGGY